MIGADDGFRLSALRKDGQPALLARGQALHPMTSCAAQGRGAANLKAVLQLGAGQVLKATRSVGVAGQAA